MKNQILPNPPSERIHDIDVLRGFALFGVIFVNIFLFNAPDNSANSYYGQYHDVINTAILLLRRWLFDERFYPIFSFLFGLGLSLQFMKAAKLKRDPFAIPIRRLTFLLFFGLIHIIFVWENDILLNYALLGFVLLGLTGRSLNFMLKAALVVYFVAVGIKVVEVVVPISSQMSDTSMSLGELVHFYTTASYWEILQSRIANSIQYFTQWDALVSELDRLAFFLLGYYVGRKNLLATFGKETRYWGKLFTWVFLFWLIGFLLDKIWLTDLRKLEDPAILLALQEVVIGLTRLFQVVVYIVGFLLLLTMSTMRRVLAPLAGVGRMALTGYLLHTILFSLVFNSYGLGLYGSLSPVQLTLLSCVFFGGLILLSVFWLRYFQYGPFEWVWRSLTYKKILPFKKQTIRTDD